MADGNNSTTSLQPRENDLTKRLARLQKIDTNNDKRLDGNELMQYALDEYKEKNKDKPNLLKGLLDKFESIKKYRAVKPPQGSALQKEAVAAIGELNEILQVIPTIETNLKEAQHSLKATTQLGATRESEQQAAAAKAQAQAEQRQARVAQESAAIQTRVDALGELGKQIEAGTLSPAQIREKTNEIMEPHERGQKTVGPYVRTEEGRLRHLDGPSFDDLLKQAEKDGMTPQLKQAMLRRLAGVQRNISEAAQFGIETITNAPVARDTPTVDPAQLVQEQRIQELGKTLLGYKVDTAAKPVTLDTLEQAVKARLNQGERTR